MSCTQVSHELRDDVRRSVLKICIQLGRGRSCNLEEARLYFDTLAFIRPFSAILEVARGGRAVTRDAVIMNIVWLSEPSSSAASAAGALD